MLANKIWSFYSEHAGDRKPKIEKGDFIKLGNDLQNLKSKLTASSDLRQLVDVLREVTKADGHAGHIEDLLVWEDTCYFSWGKMKDAMLDAIWQSAKLSLNALVQETNNIEAAEFAQLDDTLRNRYRVYTTKASSLAKEAMDAQPSMSVVISKVKDLRSQFSDLTSAIYNDVRNRTELLVQVPEAKPT